jgi:hypothetical protein
MLIVQRGFIVVFPYMYIMSFELIHPLYYWIHFLTTLHGMWINMSKIIHYLWFSEAFFSSFFWLPLSFPSGIHVLSSVITFVNCNSFPEWQIGRMDSIPDGKLLTMSLKEGEIDHHSRSYFFPSVIDMGYFGPTESSLFFEQFSNMYYLVLHLLFFWKATATPLKFGAIRLTF